MSDPKNLAIAALFAALAGLGIWCWKHTLRIVRRQEPFFDSALARADEGLKHLARVVGGRFEQGQARWRHFLDQHLASENPVEHLRILEGGSSTYCSYRGFAVRVSWTTEDLEEGMALVPRVIVEIPPERALARLRFNWHPDPGCNSAIILLRRHQRGLKDGAVSPARLSTDEARLFSLLAERSSEIAQRSPTIIDVRALPTGGQWDETQHYYGDDFDPERLRELAELAVLFAEAATTP